MQIEYIGAQVQAEYAAYAGLVHGNARLTEDISRTLTDDFEVLDDYHRRYCVAWIDNTLGQMLCNTRAEPANPCCYEVDGNCIKPNQNGVCHSTHYWRTGYTASYDSMRKSITSSAVISFEPDPDYALELENQVRFMANREMYLSWE
jgi:hypothetical protein